MGQRGLLLTLAFQSINFVVVVEVDWAVGRILPHTLVNSGRGQVVSDLVRSPDQQHQGCRSVSSRVNLLDPIDLLEPSGRWVCFPRSVMHPKPGTLAAGVMAVVEDVHCLVMIQCYGSGSWREEN